MFIVDWRLAENIPGPVLTNCLQIALRNIELVIRKRRSVKSAQAVPTTERDTINIVNT